MELVAHRVNTVDGLKKLPAACGAEIDIRSSGRKLVLAHEPFGEGDSLEDWLAAYNRSRPGCLVIFNPKEDGLDGEILRLAAAAGLNNFFLLDLSYPSIVRLAVYGGEKRIALRVSEYESAGSAAKLRGKVEWIWLDCFGGNPPDPMELFSLKKYFRVCVVSPELEGHPAERIPAFLKTAAQADAVCTKHPERWS